MPSTRQTSLSTALDDNVPNVTIWLTALCPYLLRTYSITSPRRSMQKSMSMSGGLTRSGLRNRSKISPKRNGSMSVIPRMISDERARRRTAPRPDGDALLFGVMDEVPNDEEVAGEPGLFHHAQLVLHALHEAGILAPRVRRSVAADPCRQSSRRNSSRVWPSGGW